MVAVSIVIPTFNRARFLGAAIDSALAQGEGTEVIVVDDGSTDGTAALLAGYGDRVRVARQSNQGPSAARNLGADRSLGENLFFLDSDDVLVPGAIASLLRAATRLGHGKVPFGRASIIDQSGRPSEGPDYGFPHLEAGHQLSLAELVGRVMPLCLSLVPREAFRELGGLDRDLKLGEDHEFAMRVHRSGRRYVATEVPLLRIRNHGGDRLSDTQNRDFGSAALKLWLRIGELANGAPDWSVEAAQALAKPIWIGGRDAARASDRDAANRLFKLARSLDPSVASSSPWALATLGRLAGPYLAERAAERVKTLFGRR